MKVFRTLGAVAFCAALALSALSCSNNTSKSSSSGSSSTSNSTGSTISSGTKYLYTEKPAVGAATYHRIYFSSSKGSDGKNVKRWEYKTQTAGGSESAALASGTYTYPDSTVSGDAVKFVIDSVNGETPFEDAVAEDADGNYFIRGRLDGNSLWIGNWDYQKQ